MKFCQISLLTRIRGNVNANGTIGPLTEIKKFITTEQETIVFVSGRCVKYCIKEKMKELYNKGVNLSPIIRGITGEEKVLQSIGNPIEYTDDDLFGFMKTRGNMVRKRFAAVKTNGIVSLRHCEVTKDFLARFDPSGKEFPSPAEVEVADFVGRNDWIITDRVGKYSEDELKFVDPDGNLKNDEEIEELYKNLNKKTEKEDNVFHLKDKNEVKNRYRYFLNILLKERYRFPRAANYLNIPHYYFGVIYLGEKQLPVFSYIDYKQEQNKILIDWEKLQQIKHLLKKEDKIFVISFEDNKILDLDRKEIRDVDLNKVVEEIVAHLGG